MKLDQLITSQDLPFEYSLQKDPQDINTWLKYLRSTIDLSKQVFILERCLRFNPLQEIWMEYLEVIDHCDDKIINIVYGRCLSQTNDIDIWIRYLNKLNRQVDARFIINKYIECLRSVELSQHTLIWEVFMEFIDKISHYDTDVAGELMRRFISYDEYNIEHLFKYIKWTGDFAVFYQEERTFEEWDQILELGDEEFIKMYIKKFPDQYSKGYLHLINIINPDLKIHYYEKSLDECISVYDFTKLYEDYLDYLEPNDESSDYEIDRYENLINAREVMVNNIYLKQDNNNLDVWFKRFDIFKNDLPKLLKTFVEAITTINPLTCKSSVNYRISDVWIKYAGVYGDRGDFKTVDLIFSKSIQSKFQNVDEIVNIYKSWCEFYSNDVEKQLEILQSVLFNDKVKSIALWEYYFDILEINIDDISRILSSYHKMIELKRATPKMIINFANFLESESEINEMFKIFEIGLREFKDIEIKYEIYNIYLIKMIKYSKDIERIRDLFDEVLNLKTKVLDKLSPVVILYSEFEFDQSLVLKSFNLLNDYLLKCPSVQILNIIMKKFETIDKPMIRAQFDNWLNLSWSNQDFISVCYTIIDFEIRDQQYDRARSIFKFLHNSLAVDFQKWEDFEINYGDENGFKELLSYKRKTKIEPVGFVKAIDNSNPDEIDIDM